MHCEYVTYNKGIPFGVERPLAQEYQNTSLSTSAVHTYVCINPPLLIIISATYTL